MIDRLEKLAIAILTPEQMKSINAGTHYTCTCGDDTIFSGDYENGVEIVNAFMEHCPGMGGSCTETAQLIDSDCGTGITPIS